MSVVCSLGCLEVAEAIRAVIWIEVPGFSLASVSLGIDMQGECTLSRRSLSVLEELSSALGLHVASLAHEMLFLVDLAAIPGCLDAPLPYIALTLSFWPFLTFYRSQSEWIFEVVLCRSGIHVIQGGLRSHVHLDVAVMGDSMHATHGAHAYRVRVRVVHFIIIV